MDAETLFSTYRQRHMAQMNRRDLLNILKSEWVAGSTQIFREDCNKEDHQAISKWILGLLDQETMSESEELIVNLLHHSLNFDIPFKATASVRAELLQEVRIKIADASPK